MQLDCKFRSSIPRVSLDCKEANSIQYLSEVSWPVCWTSRMNCESVNRIKSMMNFMPSRGGRNSPYKQYQPPKISKLFHLLCDSGIHRSGSAIIIKLSLPPRNLSSYTTNSIQTAVVIVHYNRHNTKVGSIYCPPCCSPNNMEFTKFLPVLAQDGSSVVITMLSIPHLGLTTDHLSRTCRSSCS